MQKPQQPAAEASRLQALRAIHILDTDPEERFDRLTRTARRVFDVSIALVSLVDENRQWFKSCQGLDARETPRDISFCGHAILGDRAFVILDALADERFCDNPLVTGAPNIRFYAGCPLTLNGHKVGTLCVIDQRPRAFSAADISALEDLACMAERELAGLSDLALERQRAENARAASEQKSRFLANMSHEIRTPMNAILGFSQLLAESVREPNDKFYAGAIAQSSKVLLSLINDVLDMSKIEAGQLELRDEPTNVGALLAGVELLFVHLTEEKGLKLAFDVAASVPHSILLDPLRLRQILINLIGNAVKYTDDGHILVAVTALASAGSEHLVDLEIKVSDSGRGIDRSQFEGIFQPFSQLQRDVGAGGTGLGLSIVKRLVEAMHGEISLESELGRGSQFTVRLAALPIATAPSATASDFYDLASLRSLKVLVVDDMPLNRQLMRSMFERGHHQVRLAVDGHDSVRLAAQQRPDVVFMDIRMPGMDGFEALTKLRALPGLEATRVIAATASSLEGEEARIRDCFDGYLRKPFSREQVAKELHRLFADGSTQGPAAVSRDESPGVPAPAVELPVVGLSHTDARRYARARQGLAGCLSVARGSFSTDDLRALAAALEALPETPGFAPLLLLGQRLQRAVAVFDLEAIDRLLAQTGIGLAALDAATNQPLAC